MELKTHGSKLGLSLELTIKCNLILTILDLVSQQDL